MSMLAACSAEVACDTHGFDALNEQWILSPTKTSTIPRLLSVACRVFRRTDVKRSEKSALSSSRRCSMSLMFSVSSVAFVDERSSVRATRAQATCEDCYEDFVSVPPLVSVDASPDVDGTALPSSHSSS